MDSGGNVQNSAHPAVIRPDVRTKLPFYISRKSPVICEKRKQEIMPMAVGSSMDRSIHRTEPVSLRMVRQVVAQGQCIREKEWCRPP